MRLPSFSNPMSDRIEITRAKTTQAGSCSACGRHPRHTLGAPEYVRVIGLGYKHCRVLVRLCDECLCELMTMCVGLDMELDQPEID